MHLQMRGLLLARAAADIDLAAWKEAFYQHIREKCSGSSTLLLIIFTGMVLLLLAVMPELCPPRSG